MGRISTIIFGLCHLAVLATAKNSPQCADLDAAFLNVSVDSPACRCYANPVEPGVHNDVQSEFWIGCNGQSMPSVYRSLHAINRTSVDHLFIWDSLLNILPADMFSQVDPRTLTIEASGVSVFRDGAFAGLEDLKKLHLRRNIFKSIDAKLFHGTPSLQLLDLSNNKLAAIENGTFASLRELRFLSLHGNAIDHLNDGSFVGLRNLRRLDLSDNHITKISSGMLEGLTNLEELSLKGNDISEVDWRALSKLPSLRTIDLGTNKISKVELNGLVKLERLSLDNNEISSLTDLHLRDLQNLKMLSLDHNRLSRIDADDFIGLEGSRLLSALSLGHNLISEIHGRSFEHTPHVSTLWLANNNLSSLEGPLAADAVSSDQEATQMFLLPLSKLQRLFISHNRIQGIGSSFRKLYMLELIALNNNNISRIEREALLGFHPKMLFLNNNSLYYLPEGLFSTFRTDDLVSVDLSHNPWECICGKEWLGSWLESIGDANTAQDGLGCLTMRCESSGHKPSDQSWTTYLAVALAFITLTCMFAIGYLLMKEYSYGKQPLFTLRRVPSDMVQLIPEGLAYPNPVTLSEPGNTCLKNGSAQKEASSASDKKHVRFNGI